MLTWMLIHGLLNGGECIGISDQSAAGSG